MAEEIQFNQQNNLINSDYFVTFDQEVVLDPTGLYNIPANYTVITTEVEWIQLFFLSEGLYWVKGKRLCDWTEEWLRVWNKTKVIREIKQDPRSIIKRIIAPFSISDNWTDKKCLEIANKLSFYPHDNPISYLLAEITDSNLQKIWLANPSREHLAEWLTIQVSTQYKILETVWQNRFKDHPLSIYYQTENKLQLLRQWLGLIEPSLPELGKYPLPIPDDLIQEFDQYWEQKIYGSEGKILDEIISTDQVGIERISKITYKIFKKRPQWITQVREKKVASYLTHQQKTELRDYQPPSQPKSLSLDATYQQALHWVTKEYLPYRRWEIVVKKPCINERITEGLAESFVAWIVKHYPELKLTPVADSFLNYNVTHRVQNLCQESPVLWVVVDGLGWLDHLELLSYLTQNQKLAIEQEIEPRFSIIPTITKYAKWSLYTQLMPNSSEWVDNIEKGFKIMGMGKRYTDQQKDKLYQDLHAKKESLYCWDTTLFDDLQHHQKDWQSFYEFERPKTLEKIAQTIHYCLEQYPKPEKLRIVIATDHGQILGQSTHISPSPPELQPSGRMAKGITDDPRFIVLDASRYDLPDNISIVKGSASFNSFNYTQDRQIIGSHGGLFPEEVVIGFSVLRQSVQRSPVLVICRGEGKPNEPGELEITIDNPNLVSLTNFCLVIEQLSSFKVGQILNQTIAANQKISLTLPISSYPELPPNHRGNQLLLSGQLTFQYADSEEGLAVLDSHSYLTIKQLFSSGLDIDEFL